MSSLSVTNPTHAKDHILDWVLHRPVDRVMLGYGLKCACASCCKAKGRLKKKLNIKSVVYHLIGSENI